MWPFRRPKLDEAQLERLRELERKVAVMEVEWSDWFDRYRRLYAKIAKRAAEVQEPVVPSSSEAPGELEAGAGAPPNGPAGPGHHFLTPAMLERRRKMRGF